MKVNQFFKRAVTGVVLLLPLLIYTCNFHNHPISEDPSDWADFAEYFGGIYSIIITIYVVYLARELSIRDEAAIKRKRAVEEIYSQIVKVDIKRINLASVNKIYNLLSKNKLYINDKLHDKIVSLADHFLEVKGGKASINQQLLKSVKDNLKEIYEV